MRQRKSRSYSRKRSGSKKPTRVIIDQDGGIDDALALILALRSPELEVTAITAVSGNVTVEQATLNGLRVVDLLNRGDVPVARGQGNPLVRNAVRATGFHGKDGLGDSNLPVSKIRPAERNAIDTIKQELSISKSRDITIICTGPLTNIAALLTSFPGAAKMIKELVIMGGAYGVTKYGVGNVTPLAEFNIYADPEAAKIVFESGVPLIAIGLDVTMIPKNQLTLTEYALIKKSRGRVAAFAVTILNKNIHKHRIFALHDPMTVATKIKPSLFEYANYHTQVETKGEFTDGMTVADRRGWLPENVMKGEKTIICRNVDSKGFKKLFLDRMVGGPSG
ncbi:MAG TPA: nucleoside hydrolase [Candidatus Bathyarchaeia archaeon]|nr:nucleoside hydrolase [Candidatus Bathyarchaeia archaeon]